MVKHTSFPNMLFYNDLMDHLLYKIYIIYKKSTTVIRIHTNRQHKTSDNTKCQNV